MSNIPIKIMYVVKKNVLLSIYSLDESYCILVLLQTGHYKQLFYETS